MGQMRSRLSHLVFALVVTVVCTNSTAQSATQPTPGWKTLKGKTVTVKYDGVGAEYAKAFLAITESAREIYTSTYHCDLPPAIQVVISKTNYAKTRLWTDGDAAVFLSVQSLNHLASPRKSGYFNINGHQSFCCRIVDLAIFGAPLQLRHNQFLREKLSRALVSGELDQ